MELGYVAAFGFIFLLIIGIYCFGYACRKGPLLYILLLETLFGLVIIVPLLIFGNGMTWKDLIYIPSTKHYLWLSTAAILGFAGGNFFSLLNLKTAGEKINSLLSPAITAFTVIFSFIIFNERLSLIQWAGLILTITVIFGFLLIKGERPISDKIITRAGWWSSVATILCISLSIIFSIMGAKSDISFLHAIAIRLFVALIIILFLFIIKREYKKIVSSTIYFYLVVIVGVLAQTICANYLWYYATFNLGISLLQVIIASLPIWVYAIDIYILRKSKPSAYFILTSLLAGVGIFLLMQ